ncbi:MAG: (2Fe-2S)-binding protein [Acetobacteraceae bacterium]|nr:(2Fe-2S)-binding protein [Acetobacteraceae bacterium]
MPDATPPAEPALALPPPLTLALTVNGARHAVEIRPWTTLLDLLRDRLHLTGTKKGCDQGQCGACTVILDGKRVNACLVLAATRPGSEVRTVEGLEGPDGALHPLQAAFIEHDAFQCGYCTPGQLCSGVALIGEGHAGSAEEIREWMSGNICRCGAYPHIVEAIREVAGR